MCNRLTKLSVTMWYTFFGIFDDTSLWILPKMHDPSLCDTPDELSNENTGQKVAVQQEKQLPFYTRFAKRKRDKMPAGIKVDNLHLHFQIYLAKMFWVILIMAD